MLTPRELQQIREYLLQYGKKDSQFPVVENMTANDLVAFVRNNENLAAHLEDIKDFIATAIADEGVYDSEGNPLVMSEENFTRILNEKLEGIQGGAQVNIIEQVKVNNTPLPVDEDKSINIDLEHYVTDDIVSENASTTNKLVDKNYVDTSIAESSATFRGTSEPGLTEQEFLAWANNLTHDLNDYVFWKTLVVGSTDEYIYHRYKWDGAAWIYEYDLIPYYLNTEDYPVANSEKAVKSSGIFAFTGDVHKDGNNNYISLQSQIDEIVSGGAVLKLTSTKSAALVGETTTFNLTATTNTSASIIRIKLGDTIIASGSGLSLTASNVSLTPSTAGNTTYTAEFVISGVTKTTTTSVAGVYPVYVGAAATVDYSNIPSTWKQTARTSPAGTYNIASIGEYIWFIYPATMTINSATMNGFDFPLEAATSQTIGGISYKTRRSSAKQQAGVTLTIVIR